jgi:hypothetical protein
MNCLAAVPFDMTSACPLGAWLATMAEGEDQAARRGAVPAQIEATLHPADSALNAVLEAQADIGAAGHRTQAATREPRDPQWNR